MFSIKVYIPTICFLLLSCSQFEYGNEIIDLRNSSIKEDTLISKKIKFSEDELYYSNYSFMQSNNSGLYITPPTPVGGVVLYKYDLINSGDTARVTAVMKKGRGPEEMESIFLSSKTINGDTLMFSSPGNKTFIVNQNGSLSQWEFDTRGIINFGYSFSYGEKKLLIPSFNPSQESYLFTIYDIEEDSSYNFFTPRVPYGFEPSIRNEILGETPMPDGFAISFLGDKKVYILNFNGRVKKEIILGESDEIPKPYKINNPHESPGAIPYITKMEFYNKHLLVLLDNIIWIMEYPSFSLKKKIKLLNNKEAEISPILDFSISDKYLFSRIGREGIYYIETDENWFK
tara:strand:+ start:292 stop:1323 length:1032 start_codon:yes stop_codon:yes gene_type:complete